MSDATCGYAISQNDDGSWSYRTIKSDWELSANEVFIASYEEFPQEAKDWFLANSY